MKVQITVNGKLYDKHIPADMLLLDFLRKYGYVSVKRGCDTANCGLCTVWVDEKPVLSCTYPAARADGRQVTTLEGLEQEAQEFGRYLAQRGAEQCGFCSPGFVMNVLAMKRELDDPTDEEIREYLAGNLCRCTGYTAQMEAVRSYLREVRR
ncbi:MAG: (2Fe-2S)-binding protein [Anaerotruncus sp.]|nr:(2Fe-2S)-binding protein [Anaerotruncus sp.]